MTVTVAEAAPVAPGEGAPAGHWFGPEEAPLLGWLSLPSRPCGRGVVVVQTVGYSWWSAHGTARALAEGLAAEGATVLRYDHHGTGDSSGSPLEPDRFATWREGVRAAADELRRLGCGEVVLVGLEVGASLALLEAGAAGATAVALVAPATRGRRLVSELRLVAEAVPDPRYPEGSVVHAGTVLSADLLGDLRGIDLRGAPASELGAALVVERAGRPPEDDLVAHLEEAGVAVERRSLDLEACLGGPTEYAEVPDDLVGAVTAWFRDLPPPPARPSASQPAAVAGHPGPVGVAEGLTEEVVTVVGLTGVRCRPTGASRGTVVLLSPGSEPHVGPGRAWVELARGLAGAGWSSLRVDFSGWGESPERGHRPGRPYDAHCVDECAELAAAVTEVEGRAPVLFGLCAGAWVALRAVADGASAAGVIALNPQLYWQPGDPVEADIVAETHVRRQAEIAHHREGHRLGVWDALDRVGLRHPAAPWLDRLAATGVPTSVLFAEGDDGLEFLEQRVARSWRRALRGGITTTTLPGIDHGLRRHWLRPVLLDAVLAALPGG